MEVSGLSTSVAAEYLKQHGYNEIIEHQESLLVKIVKRSVSPISLMLLFAAILSLVSGKNFDFFFILFLLALNVGVTVWQEHKADTAIEQLNEHLATMVRVRRDGKWQDLVARCLVPRDLVELQAGSIVPADAKIVEAHNVSANEASLTGESLPKEKASGDVLYSGSFLASGLAKAEIAATGANTYFGRTLTKIDARPRQSALERDVLRISRFLSLLALGAVIFLTVILFLHQAPWAEVLRLDLSLAIAGVPISLSTVMTVIIAFGVARLARKSVVVRRLSALEELANADLLLTDKTGTLTKNHIVVSEVKLFGPHTLDEVGRYAALVASSNPDTVINKALLDKYDNLLGHKPAILKYVPADSVNKRSHLLIEEENRKLTVILGAPQIVASLSRLQGEELKQFYRDVDDLATRGFRTLALATALGEKEEGLEMLGLLALSDELREDAGEVVEFLNQNGIGVVMVTGDNRAIAEEVSGELHLAGSKVVTREELQKNGFENLTAETFRETRAFAEILPEDKYELVNQAKRFYTVASNGDGVNDLPALKAANVSFAVANAVDALKGAADIVLLSEGIAVMRDAFIEGRKIFARLYSYSLYRISESFRLIITIVILGLLTGTYPLSPLQLILLALLNDIPIISLAFDRVRIATRPSKINVREQFFRSVLYGLVGVVNSLLLFFFAIDYLHLSLPVVETLFFLKLTVSGHLLIYITHTKARWYRFLPSKEVILATTGTQAVATLLAASGFLMPAAISWKLILFIWVWAFVFMQVGELVKHIGTRPATVVKTA